MSSELTRLSATELVAAYGRKDLSPLEVTQAVLDGIEAFDPQVNAFCVVDGERAIEAARTSEARWQRGEPLGLVDGVPATIKDIVLAAGWPTLRGSLAVARDQDWSDDAPATARLREHGAVLLGKTTTPEFGWKGVTDSPLTGITRNPWNTDLTPGGSSGGAAAACALGLGALHVGTDGGGSIRIPAGFTGIFGLKATFGRVPAWPSSPFGTVAHVGPLTRTVTDAALMLSVLAEPDTRDWHALPASGRDYRVGLEDGVRGLRIAFSPDLGHVDVDPEVTEAVARAAHAFTELGAHVEEIPGPFESPADCFRVHWYVGAATLLARFDEAQRAKMDTGLQEIAAEGARITTAEYMQAMSDRAALGERMGRFHESWDLLLSPTLPIPAFAAGTEFPEEAAYARWRDWTPFTYPFNLTQQPAASVPCGFTAAGAPIGMQIVGAKFADALVLRAARSFESRGTFSMPEEPRSPSN
jgi:aspartyl-tRNA(Asn)/glutamyl-tRNA(Gln) amidotransferase subunit A